MGLHLKVPPMLLKWQATGHLPVLVNLTPNSNNRAPMPLGGGQSHQAGLQEKIAIDAPTTKLDHSFCLRATPCHRTAVCVEHPTLPASLRRQDAHTGTTPPIMDARGSHSSAERPFPRCAGRPSPPPPPFHRRQTRCGIAREAIAL